SWAGTRRTHGADRLVREGQWEGWAPTPLLGADVFGKTLGIIGMGRIGRAVARRAGGFGMTVLYHTRHPLRHEEEVVLHAKFLPLPRGFRAPDTVTTLPRLIDSTRGRIDKADLAWMRRWAYLISTARGAVVERAAW